MTSSTPNYFHTNFFSCNFNGQPIPPNYYDLLNDDDDNGNNITGPPFDNDVPDNKGLEYEVVPNDGDINNEIIIYEDDSLDSEIDPPKKK